MNEHKERNKEECISKNRNNILKDCIEFTLIVSLVVKDEINSHQVQLMPVENIQDSGYDDGHNGYCYSQYA